MTGHDLRAARIALNLNMVQLADKLGVPVLRVKRYEYGVYPVPRYIELAMRELIRMPRQAPRKAV